MSNLSFAQTADGSKTIFNAEIGEHYHSKHGALQESNHVFLHSGSKYFLEITGSDKADILEVGFGTGLNFLITADYCIENNIRINYTGIEAYPLSLDMISETGYEQYISESTWNLFLRNYKNSLKEPIQFSAGCGLHIANQKVINFYPDKLFDVIYFDAFAAVHQPEMWTNETLSHVCSFLKPGGVFVTYAITGNLKRCMKSLGFRIEKTPGAPGKREMLRAVKL